MGHIGDHVFVGTDTGRQDFRDVRVRQGRETPVDTAGRGDTPFGADIAESVDERENTVFVVVQDLLVITRLHAAEGHGGPVGEPEGKNGRGDIRAERDNTGVPADLNPGFDELVGHAGAVVVGCTEDVQVLLLVVFHDHLGGFRIRAGAYDGRKARGTAVHELYPALTQDNVVGRTDPHLAAFQVGIFLREVEIRFAQNPQGLDDLVGENGSHTGVQQGPEIWQMVFTLDVRRQQPAREFQGFFQIFQFFHLHAGQRVDNGQVVTGIGKFNLRIRIKGLKRIVKLAFSLGDNFIATLNGCKCY